MKLFNPLSVATLVSVALAIPQHSHGDSAENASIFSDIFSSPTDLASSNGNSINISNDFSNFSKSKVNKPGDRFLGLGITRGLSNANVDVSNVGCEQADIIGSDEITNDKADAVVVFVGTNLRGNGYPYPPYYPSYPPSYHPLTYPPHHLSNPFQSSQPSQSNELSGLFSKFIAFIQPLTPAFD
jgi:hypothetical protein